MYFADFFQFAIRPNFRKFSSINNYIKSTVLIGVLFFNGLIAGLSYVIINFINSHLYGINGEYTPKLNTTFLEEMLLVIPLALVEELLFRLPLKPNRINLSISATICFVYFFSAIFSFEFMENLIPYLEENHNLFLLAYYCIILFFFIFCFYFFSLTNISSKFQVLETKYFHYFFYLLTLLFAYLHLNINFDNIYLILTEIIYFIKFLIVGISLGYLRVRLGFGWAVLAHIIWNSTLMGFQYFLNN